MPFNKLLYVTYHRLLVGKIQKEQMWQALKSLSLGAALGFSDLHLDSDPSSLQIWCLFFKLCFLPRHCRSRALNPGLVHHRQVLYHSVTAQVSPFSFLNEWPWGRLTSHCEVAGKLKFLLGEPRSGFTDLAQVLSELLFSFKPRNVTDSFQTY